MSCFVISDNLLIYNTTGERKSPSLDPLVKIKYDCPVMKQSIHPTTYATKIHCNSCDTQFEIQTTVPEITVEICSNCHPFYTGKQKLLDVAGRVDRFKARQAQATKHAEERAATENQKDAELAKIQSELQNETEAVSPAEA